MLDSLLRKLSVSVLLVLIIAASLMLQGCDKNPKPDDPKDSGTPQESLNDTTADNNEPSSSIDIISDGKMNYKIVRPEDASKEQVACATLVYNAFTDIVGNDVVFSDDYVGWDEAVDQEAYEILVGVTNRDASISAMESLKYGDWLIKVDGNKIVIVAFSTDALNAACSAFIYDITENTANGSLSFDRSYSKTGCESDIVNSVPRYAAGNEKSQTSIIDLADENYMIHISNTTLEEYNTYLKALANDGFTQYQSRTVTDNVFSIYTNSKYTVSAQFTKSDKASRIIVEPNFSMDLFEKKEYTKVCEPAVTMVGLERYGDADATSLNQIGLFLVFTLEDGRLVVVDGGGYYQKCVSIVRDALRGAAPDPNKIVVAAWFFTHAHGDHTGGFNKFAESEYGRTIKVENFIFNFTTDYNYTAIGDTGRANQTRNNVANIYPNANIIKAHVGQVYKFADAEIEMLCTYDTILPFDLNTHNTTSLVFRYTTNGQSVMVLGDSYTTTSNRIVSLYGDYLKSDIVNISHHGYVGGTASLYNRINAPTVLWTSGKNAYNTNKERSYSSKAIALATDIYVAADVTTRLQLPHTPVDK